MIVFPNAKINIGLNIISKRSDGYHNLETVLYPLGLHDALEMAETGSDGLSFSGIPVNCPNDENLVIKAYKLLKRDFGLLPVQFHLHKIIPYGAGLGGGSSNAAFTLKMVNDYFNLNLDAGSLKKYASQIGSDCPFFIDNVPALAKGKGEELYPNNLNLSPYKIIVLKPPFEVNTCHAYKNALPSEPSFDLKDLPLLPVEEWKGIIVNDFEKTIFLQYPEIEKLKKTLYKLGALYSSMSGSGSSVFGIFKDLPGDLQNKIPSGVLFAG